MVLSDNERGWLLAVCSGLSCVLGSWIICSDLVLRRFERFQHFDIREDKRILVYGFSLSSGVMLLTSMYELLPESLDNIVSSPTLFGQQTPAGLVVMASYVLGVGIFGCLNLIIHSLTQRSVVHCAHENLGDEHDHGHSHGQSQFEDTVHVHEHSHSSEAIARVASYGATEKTPLGLSHRSHNHGDEPVLYPVLSATSILTYDVDSTRDCEKQEFESSSSSSVTMIAKHDRLDPTMEAPEARATDFADLFSIGLQTSLAISLHKIPEGFVTFATSYANPELGYSVFIALAIHNFIEGFTIAFPLYLALGSRPMALGAAFVLGGLSQPVGALIAWLVFRGQEPSTEGSMVYGILFGVVGGFLTIIALQMFATAVSFSRKPNVCINWAFAGIVLVGIAMSLSDV